MKRALFLCLAVLVIVAGVGYVSYLHSQAPKPAPTTVPVSQYKALEDKYQTLEKVDQFKLKQVADQVIVKDEVIKSRTSQRDSLCTTYKNFRPAPTPAQCQ